MMALPAFPEFTFSTALAVLFALWIIDATKNADLKFTCVLFPVIFYAAKVLLDMIARTYDLPINKVISKQVWSIPSPFPSL